MQEGRPVCTKSDSFIALGLFVGLLHHDFLASSCDVLERLVLDFSGHAKVIDESLLFRNLSLLLGKLIFHLLELLGQEFVLLTELLSGNGELLVLFLGVDEI